MKIEFNTVPFLNNTTDLTHKDVVIIETEGKWIQSNKWKKEDGSPVNEFRLNLKLKNGEIKNTTFGWNNVKMLVEAFGDETASWIGKELRAWKTKSERAKSGFTFVFAPISWERDEIGEWHKAPVEDNQDIKKEEVPSVQVDENYPQEPINTEDIPF